MTLRPVTAATDNPLVRRSARVSTVAEMLDDTPSQIRRMIDRGEIEAHREGKRGIRVFLDSVQAWQERHPIKAKNTPKAQEKPKTRAKASAAAHNQAMAHLRDLGLVQ
jgi:excisionase family DNA binding protein